MDDIENVLIDKDDLDGEWIRLPTIYYECSVEESELRGVVSRLTLDKDKQYYKCKTLYAQIALAIRNDPVSYGLQKMTESALDQAVLTTKEYQEAQQTLMELNANLVEAQYRLDKVAVLKWSLELKKKALEGLTQLWASNYFTVTRENKNLYEMAKAHSASHQQTELNNRMNRRMKGVKNGD